MRPSPSDPRRKPSCGALRQLQGIPLPAELWEQEILPRSGARLPAALAWTSSLAAGEVGWVGSPGKRLAFYLPDDVHAFAGRLAAGARRARRPVQAQVLAACQSAGARSWTLARLAGLTPAETLEALWALVYEDVGVVTNDPSPRCGRCFGPAGLPERPEAACAPAGADGRRMAPAALAETGTADPAEIYARLLLDRYASWSRETVAADEGPLSWGEVLPCLRRMGGAARCRRGSLVAGLTGAHSPGPMPWSSSAGQRPDRRHAAAPERSDPANPLRNRPPLAGGGAARTPGRQLPGDGGRRPVLGAERYGGGWSRWPRSRRSSSDRCWRSALGS